MLKKLITFITLFSVLAFATPPTPTPPYPFSIINTTGTSVTLVTNTANFVFMYGLVFTVSGATVATIQDSCSNTFGVFNLTANGSSVSFPLKDLGANPYYSTGKTCNLTISSTNSVTFQGTVWYFIS